MHAVLQKLTESQIRADHPDFRAGDTVSVHFRVREGEEGRIQIFKGVVIGISGGGISETFTVRKISNGIGVERIFPVNSPRVELIEIDSIGRVRRAKLYYLRSLSGKAARIRSKRNRKGI